MQIKRLGVTLGAVAAKPTLRLSKAGSARAIPSPRRKWRRSMKEVLCVFMRVMKFVLTLRCQTMCWATKCFAI